MRLAVSADEMLLRLILHELVAGVDAPKSPRGVRGFQLNTGNFSDWRVQGKIGGFTEYYF